MFENKNRYQEPTKWELLFEKVFSFLRDTILFFVIAAMLTGLFFLFTSNVKASEDRLSLLGEQLHRASIEYHTELKAVAQQKIDEGISCSSASCEEVITQCDKELGIIPEVSALDKLAMAVAMHETHNCQDVTNFTKWNNCHGIRTWDGTKLRPRRYATIQDSHEDFKEIWGRMYGTTTPTKTNAIRWSGNDNATAWLDNVTYFLNTI